MRLLRVFLLAASVGIPSSIAVAQEPSANATVAAVMANADFIDLTWPLNENNAFWPGDNYEPFKLETIATLERDGVYSRKFSMPEHLGTHIDAPNHFESGQPDVAALTAEQLCGPGVVLDITVKAELNPDAMLRIGDIQGWEEEHGRIPDGAVVLLRTGWGRFWNNPVRYQNRDARGQLHFPSFSPEAAEYLVEKRNIRGVGVDNLSIDRGISREFEVHHIINAAQRYGLENV
ncbi:MAG: cyclase family protein, partial [Maioricimonas sp. JB049]